MSIESEDIEVVSLQPECTESECIEPVSIEIPVNASSFQLHVVAVVLQREPPRQPACGVQHTLALSLGRRPSRLTAPSGGTQRAVGSGTCAIS